MPRGRKKKEQPIEIVKKEDIDELREAHTNEVEKDVQYSLIVDPTNKYEFDESEKKFIEHYIQLRNIDMAASLADMDPIKAMSFCLSYNAQEEIRRINKAITHRQFETKMANLDQIGGYLTSLLTEEFTPMHEQLSMQDKLQVSKMLIEVNKLQQEGISNPSTIMGRNLDIDFNNLSVKTIKSLLDNMDSPEMSHEQLAKMSPEEIARTKTQSQEITELQNMIKKRRGEK